MRSILWSLTLLTRGHFLLGGVLMYAAGVSAAHADGAPLDWPVLLWGQLGVSAIQLMTHLTNEYYDAARDALVLDRTWFSGGSGVLPAGRLAVRVAAAGAAFCALLGLAVAFTVRGPFHPQLAPLYVLALLIGYGYSAPPLRLMTRGVGEIGAALAVALLTPLSGYGVAAGRLSLEMVWFALPLFSLSLAFMISVELPDYEADRPTGKRNWVVRLGRARAAHLHNALIILAYSLLAWVGAVGVLPQSVVTLLWFTLPVAVWQMGGVWLRVFHGWKHYTWLLAGSMVLIGLYGLLGALGYWL